MMIEHSAAVVVAMSDRARSLGQEVIADGLVSGVITAPAIAAFCMLELLTAAEAGQILTAGRDADDSPELWQVWIAVLSLPDQILH
jgi:hypothetical protein